MRRRFLDGVHRDLWAYRHILEDHFKDICEVAAESGGEES